MILVTIGTNDAPYEPLFEAMDAYAGETGEEVVIQKAHSAFEAKHCECFAFKPDAEFSKYYDRADLIVCHAGIGTIMNGLERNIPLVLVPREVVLPDSVSDQQGIVARRIADIGRGVCVNDLSELYDKIAEARALEFSPYVKDTGLTDYIAGRLSELAAGKEGGHKYKRPPTSR